MKTWHVVAVAVGLGAAIYLYRSTGGGFARIATSTPYIPPSTGPATEAKSGRLHFTGASPIVAAGPTVEGKAGRSHF